MRSRGLKFNPSIDSTSDESSFPIIFHLLNFLPTDRLLSYPNPRLDILVWHMDGTLCTYIFISEYCYLCFRRFGSIVRMLYYHLPYVQVTRLKLTNCYTESLLIDMLSHNLSRFMYYTLQFLKSQHESILPHQAKTGMIIGRFHASQNPDACLRCLRFP